MEMSKDRVIGDGHMNGHVAQNATHLSSQAISDARQISTDH